jgi:hypothetical protein
MNPFWKILKINILEERTGWILLMKRENVWMSNQNGLLNMSNQPLDGGAIGKMILDRIDEDFTHLLMKPRKKLCGVIDVY